MRILDSLYAIATVSFFTSIANAQPVTYTAVEVSNLGTINYTSCPTGPCQNYSASSKVSGYFVTSERIPPNLWSVDVSDKVTHYHFTDGINMFSSSNPSSRIGTFFVNTSSTGDLQASLISVQSWLTGTAPHSPGDRLSYMSLNPVSEFTHNNGCLQIGQSFVGTTDFCTNLDGAAGSSRAYGPRTAFTASPPSAIADASVPSNSALGLLTLSALVGAAGLVISRRNRGA